MADMYDFENRLINDGDPLFGIPDTFRIHDTAYILSPAAAAKLPETLALYDYAIKEDLGEFGLLASKTHKFSRDEIVDSMGLRSPEQPLTLTVSFHYIDGHKHSLEEKFIHETILAHASQPTFLNWYHRATDRFDDIIKGRMSAFVTRLVDVDPKSWEEFLENSQNLHAQEFIKSMAAWASLSSDEIPRHVQVDTRGYEYVEVRPHDTFKPRKPNGGWRFEP